MFVLRHKNMIYIYNDVHTMNRSYERALKGSESAYMQNAMYALELSDEYKDMCRIVKDRTYTFMQNTYHNTEKMLKMIKILVDS
jgi:proteasome assembly chaperone (PAC2) family protein